MVELKGTKRSEGTRRSQRSRWGTEKGIVEVGPSGSGGELALLIWGLFCCLDEQNSLLDKLVGLKEQEVYVMVPPTGTAHLTDLVNFSLSSYLI